MLTKENKKEVVSNIEEWINSAKSVVFVNFHKLSVADSGSLRKVLKENLIKFSVVKKTLVKRALDLVKITGKRPELKGELALAFGDDSIAPARGVYEFEKKLEGKVSIMGGIFEGRYMSREEMTEIASIPTLEVLRGMFVNIINSPVQRFAIALNQIAEKK